MDKILIFGVNGFSGRYFLNYILQNKLNEKYQIYGLGTQKKCIFKEINYKYIDIKKNNDVKKILIEYKPNYIINFVGKYGTDDIEELFSKNFELTKNIIYSVISNQIKIKKILVIGSAAEYGIPENEFLKETDKLSPINFYGLSKKIQTEFAVNAYKIKNIPINVARTFNLFGDGISELLLPGKLKKLISEVASNANIEMSNLSDIRDYIEIEKAVDMYWKILIDGIPGEIYNVCSGVGMSSRDILRKLINESGKNINFIENKNLHSKIDINKIIGCNIKITNLMNK
jgi:GDP-4-dehydro-6-deoxy-D-mannose reductase